MNLSIFIELFIIFESPRAGTDRPVRAGFSWFLEMDMTTSSGLPVSAWILAHFTKNAVAAIAGKCGRLRSLTTGERATSPTAWIGVSSSQGGWMNFAPMVVFLTGRAFATEQGAIAVCRVEKEGYFLATAPPQGYPIGPCACPHMNIISPACYLNPRRCPRRCLPAHRPRHPF